MHANIVLFNNNTCRKNRNDNVPKWMIIFQIIFWNVLVKVKNWFINCVGFTSAYTTNGRQRTAEEDLQEFLNKSPTASRPNEADRLSSHLLRWFLQSDITSIHVTYIQRTHVDRVLSDIYTENKILIYYMTEFFLAMVGQGRMRWSKWDLQMWVDQRRDTGAPLALYTPSPPPPYRGHPLH